MRKHGKKALSLLLALVMVLAMVPVSAFAAEPTSGKCGDNLTWSLNNGVLTISGTGAMENYTFSSGERYSGNTKTSYYCTNAPWFNQGNTIRSVIINEGVTTIGDFAFNYIGKSDSNTFSVSIPNTVTSIGRGAFMESGVADVNIPNSVTSLGQRAFQECMNLTSITIPGSVTNLNGSEFCNCDNLVSAYISDGVPKISNSMFNSCNKLTNLRIPNSITAIEAYALVGTNMTSIDIPAGVSRIETNVFLSCKSLTNVTLPNGVTKIEWGAFANCESLTSINLPVSVTEVSTKAFAECKALKDVYYGGAEAQWKSITIESENQYLTSATIHYNSSTGGNPNTPVAPTGTAKIVALSPESGATLPGSTFDITFDRDVLESTSNQNVPVADLSGPAPFQIHHMSDDAVVYTVDNQYKVISDFRYGASRAVLRVNPTNANAFLQDGEKYYVTMGAGFVKFADGSVSPEIKKGEWTFKTKATSDPSATERTVKIQMKVADGGQNKVVSALWNDVWFNEPADDYNHELARTSAALCGASYVEDAAEKPQPTAITKALEDLEFDLVTSYNYSYPLARYDNDVAAYTFGFRQIDIAPDGRPVYVVAVVIKGTSANEEWFSNFNVGTDDTHLGFKLAEEDLWKNLEDYMYNTMKIGIEEKGALNFLITGHSRGAAVANLLAARLTDSVFAEKDDVFTYTFATPMVSKNGKEAGYENIFNIISGEDFVTRVPLAKWGFKHYGVDLLLPSKSYSGANYSLCGYPF